MRTAPRAASPPCSPERATSPDTYAEPPHEEEVAVVGERTSSRSATPSCAGAPCIDLEAETPRKRGRVAAIDND